MTLYRLENISKQYNGRTVLSIPELALVQGAIYSLTGPNGAGKTTLLNILSLLDPPSAGVLYFKGRPVGKAERQREPLRKNVVLVNQHPIMFSSSVEKNIEFGLRMRKIPRKKIRQIVQNSMAAVDMKGFANMDARFLSGGETRRVAIARALACNPDVLLLDEPTADLDLESQRIIENIIRSIHQNQKITILFCTHNLKQAARLTNQNIYLLDGRIRAYIHENIFRGRVCEQNGKTVCRITEDVCIPVNTTKVSEIKISINPKSIQPTASEFDPAAPVFAGRLVELVEDHEAVRGLIDIGIQLTMIMDKGVYQQTRPSIGDPINISIQPEGVDIIEQKVG